MSEKPLLIDVPGAGSVTAIRADPEGDSGWQFIYAPGAGSNVHDQFGTFACRMLAGREVATVRFQFPYQEAGKKGPDRPPVLEATWRAVIEAVRSPDCRLVVGGRSMGGRIASQVVAEEEPVDALVLFAYPLHAPGKPDRRRDEHLPRVTVPALFCSGTSDAFGSPEEIESAAVLAAHGSTHFMEGADHGFNVKKASGRSRTDVWEEAVEAMWEWLSNL